MKYFGVNPTAQGELKISTEPLGKGGEGSVYAVTSHSIAGLTPASQLVAKIYHEPELEDRFNKIKAMIKSPVTDSSLAWPKAVIIDENKKFQGYLMMKLPKDDFREWLYLSNAKDRSSVASKFNVYYAFMAIRNLAVAMLAVHEAGHRIGDVNESNIFVNGDSTILIVDTDSMQIAKADGSVIPCVVGKPEYTAPELTRGSLRDHKRTIESDYFAFAVAAYQMFVGGATPHMGAFDPNNPDDPLALVERIRQGVIPGLLPNRAAKFGFTPRPGIPFQAIPNEIREFLIAFLNPDPKSRSVDASGQSRDLYDFLKVIDEVIDSLKQCSVVETHWYKKDEGSCPWCASARVNGGIDMWSSSKNKLRPVQKSLPAISFEDEQAVTAPRRASPNASHGSANGQKLNSSNTPSNLFQLPPRVGPAASPNLNTITAPVNPYALGPTNPPTTNYTGNPNTPNYNSLMQGANSSQQTNQQQAPQQNPFNNQASNKPEPPKKWKGKLVLTYTDGTQRVRPPLAQLFKSDPKTAIYAIKEETPSWLNFWWSIRRDIAPVSGLWIGLALSLPFAVLCILTSYIVGVFFFMPGNEEILKYVALTSGAVAFLFPISLFFSALRDRWRTKKKIGSIDHLPTEKPWRTSLRFIPVAIFYSLPLFTVVAGIIFSILRILGFVV